MCRSATITLTAGTAVLTTTANSGATPTTGFLTSGADTINATFTAAAAPVIQDVTANDGDVLNVLVSGGAFAPIMTGIETVNAQVFNNQLTATNISGTNTYNISGAGTATIVDQANGTTVSLNTAAQNFATDVVGDTATNAMTLQLNGIAAGTVMFGTADNTGDFDQVTVNSAGAAANSFTLLTTDFSNATTDLMTITGTQNLTMSGLTAVVTGGYFNATALAAPVFTINLTDDTNTGINFANTSGVDVVNFSNAAGITGGNDAVTGVSSGTNFTFTPTNAAVTHGNLSFAGGTAAQTGAADSMTLTLAGTSVGTGTIATTSMETLNLVSSGSAATTTGTVTMTASAFAETLMVSGNTALTVGAVTADVINASALTAAFTMTGVTVAAAGAIITGSATAANTIIGSAQADQFTGGSATDTYVLAATGGSGMDTITNFTRGATNGDVIRFADLGTAGALVTGEVRLQANAGAIATALGGVSNGEAGDSFIILNNATHATAAAAEDASAIVTAAGTAVTGNAAVYILYTDGTNGFIMYDADHDTDGNLAATANVIQLTGISTTAQLNEFVLANFSSVA